MWVLMTIALYASGGVNASTIDMFDKECDCRDAETALKKAVGSHHPGDDTIYIYECRFNKNLKK